MLINEKRGSIGSIAFSPVSPYDFMTASSVKLSIYSSKTHTLKSSINKFKDTLHAIDFRHDGKMICAGDATGLIQVFTVNNRSSIRSLKGHERFELLFIFFL